MIENRPGMPRKSDTSPAVSPERWALIIVTDSELTSRQLAGCYISVKLRKHRERNDRAQLLHHIVTP